MRQPIGLIGVGRMGLEISGRLVRGGYRVVVHDRRPECAVAAHAVGAGWIGDPVELGRSVDVLATVLPGPNELREIMEPVLAAMQPQTTWIDMTSSSPTLVAGLGVLARAQDVEYLEASLGGGPAEARTGTLQLFVGGSVKSVQAHRALLETLGEIDHIGEHGSGYTTKLIVNLLWFGQALATAEALLLARKSGLDVDVVRAALARSSAQSAFIRDDLDALLRGDYLTSFGLDRCCEELDEIVSLASQVGAPAEFGALVRKIYSSALDRFGPVDGEMLPIALLEERAQTLLRHTEAINKRATTC